MLELDRDVSLWFALHRQAWLTQAMLLVSEAHGTVIVLAATAGIALWRAWRRDRNAVRALFVVPAAMLLNFGCKNVFQRARPVFDDPLVQLATYSFPSGHAIASTVFYGTLWALAMSRLRSRALRIAVTVAAVLLVLLVCFSRVYLGAHYPSDVMAGMALGLLCLLAFQHWGQR
jgi:undecaprenyl-diphosphatase